MKTPVGYVLAAALLLVSNLANAFDCTKAGSRVEKMICADRLLGALEDQMEAYFQEVYKRWEGVSISQQAWWKQREACPDPACVARLENERIDILDEMLRRAAGYTETPKIAAARNAVLAAQAAAAAPVAPPATAPPDSRATTGGRTPEQIKAQYAELARDKSAAPDAGGHTVRAEHPGAAEPDSTPYVPKDAPKIKSDTPEPPGFFSRMATAIGNIFVAIGHGLWWLLKLVLFIAFLIAAGYAYKRAFTFLGATLEDSPVTPGRRRKLWAAMRNVAWFAFLLLILWRLVATVGDTFDWLDSRRPMLITPWLLATRLYVELWALSATINLARIYTNGRGWKNRKRLFWGSVVLCFMLGFPTVEFVVSSSALLGQYLPSFYEIGRLSPQDLNAVPWWIGPIFAVLIVLLVPLFLYLTGLGQLSTIGATATFFYGLLVFFPVFFAKQLMEYDQAMAISRYQQGYFTQRLARFHDWLNNIEVKPPPEPKGATYQNRQGSRFATDEEIAMFLTPEPPDPPPPAPAIAGVLS